MKKLGVLTLVALLGAAQAKDATFTIGYQKGGLLTILKGSGALDKYKKQGITFDWQLFTAGPPLLEAERAGAVDFGAVGDSPGIFALAAGAPLKYISVAQSNNKKGSALIVLADSPIRKISDLKGKKIALTRGSSAHYLTEKILEEGKLTLNQVEVVNLLPPDARPAFQSGAVDAWTIWEPYLSITSKDLKVRVIRDSNRLQPSLNYFLASEAATKDPEKLKALKILDTELSRISVFVNKNPQKAIDQWQAELGLPREVLESQILNSLPYVYKPLTSSQLSYLQNVADTFYKLQVIPTKLTLSSSNIFKLP